MSVPFRRRIQKPLLDRATRVPQRLRTDLVVLPVDGVTGNVGKKQTPCSQRPNRVSTRAELRSEPKDRQYPRLGPAARRSFRFGRFQAGATAVQRATGASPSHGEQGAWASSPAAVSSDRTRLICQAASRRSRLLRARTPAALHNRYAAPPVPQRHGETHFREGK